MSLKQQIFELCNKMAQNGWREMILSVTSNQLDIKQQSAEKLISELLKPLTNGINRNIEGFEDYRLDGNQGITPSSFSKSLLYHALASPDVIPASITYYPSLEELDLVENFIHSTPIQERNLSGLKALHGTKLVVAIFAYQYRTWEGSCHRLHADMNYSRTGIARVGSDDSIYDNKRRSFWVGDTDGAISALPCRYAAFLAIKDTGSNLKKDFSVMDMTNSDNSKEFIVPIHKLFNGDECLSDVSNLKLDFETYHRNEKLRKVHDMHVLNTIPIDAKYEVNKFPFVIDNHTKPGFIYADERFTGSILIKPTKGKIVEPAIQNDKYVAFNVPQINSNNRFSSSFQIEITQNGRSAPEYVNIRQVVKNINVVNPESDIKDLNDLPLNEFNKLLNEGGYLAVDFTDRTADGFIKLKNFETLPNFSAYSLITAIDFFPLINQRDIFRWDNSDSITHFNQGSPAPLSNGRITANINYLPFKSDRSLSFTAVVSGKQSLIINPSLKKETGLLISYLPDAASNVFAPGWDTSMDIKNKTPFYAAYGLGSPFPEDAKLCAALNSFWPAAAPDASRTFFISNTLKSNTSNGGAFDNQFNKKKPTAIPLTDEELGIHPKNANIIGISSKKGWDGEYGPFLEKEGSKEFVNYADIARSDYAFNAWKGFMNMDLLRRVTTEQLIKRMVALQKCIFELLPPQNDSIVKNDLWLVSFQEIANWSIRTDRMSPQLNADGFRFIFITPKENDVIVDSTDIKRLRMQVDRKFECQLDNNTFVWREITQTNTIVLNAGVPKINFISQLIK